jgi:hypothetical protein
LKEYHKDFDHKNKVWRSSPVHDWSSNGADAFRYLAMAVEHKPRADEYIAAEEDLFDENGYY